MGRFEEACPFMHQINPVRPAEAARSEAHPLTSRQAALTGRLDTAVDRLNFAGISYQQDAQGGAR